MGATGTITEDYLFLRGSPSRIHCIICKGCSKTVMSLVSSPRSLVSTLPNSRFPSSRLQYIDHYESLSQVQRNNGYLAHPLKLVAAPEFKCSFLAQPSSPSLAYCGSWNPVFQQPVIVMSVFIRHFYLNSQMSIYIYIRIVFAP